MELRGAVVADAVLEMLVAAEVHRLVLGLRGDEVPAGAAAADMVDGEETARDVVRLVVGGGAGRDQADVLRDHTQCGDRAHRLDMRLPAALHPERQAAIGRGAARDGDRVLEEQAVEQAALGHARHVDQVLHRQVGLGDRFGMAPARGMAARHAEEGAKAQLASRRFHDSPPEKLRKSMQLVCQGKRRAAIPWPLGRSPAATAMWQRSAHGLREGAPLQWRVFLALPHRMTRHWSDAPPKR